MGGVNVRRGTMNLDRNRRDHHHRDRWDHRDHHHGDHHHGDHWDHREIGPAADGGQPGAQPPGPAAP
jgi:hypothetical protein